MLGRPRPLLTTNILPKPHNDIAITAKSIEQSFLERLKAPLAALMLLNRISDGLDLSL